MRERVSVREVSVSPVPLTEDHDAKHVHSAAVSDMEGMVQNRQGCCGTMNLPEYLGTVQALDNEYAELKKTSDAQKRQAA